MNFLKQEQQWTGEVDDVGMKNHFEWVHICLLDRGFLQEHIQLV